MEDDEWVDKHDEDEEEDEEGEPAKKKTKVVTPEPEAVPPEQPRPPGPVEAMVDPTFMEEYFDRFVGFVVDHPKIKIHRRRHKWVANPYGVPSDLWSPSAAEIVLTTVAWTPEKQYDACDWGCPCCRFQHGVNVLAVKTRGHVDALEGEQTLLGGVDVLAVHLYYLERELAAWVGCQPRPEEEKSADEEARALRMVGLDSRVLCARRPAWTS